MTRAEQFAGRFASAVRDAAPLYLEGQCVNDFFVVRSGDRDVLMRLDAMISVIAATHGMATVRFTLSDGAECVPAPTGPTVDPPRLDPEMSPSDQIGALIRWLRDETTPVLLRISPLESLVPADAAQFTQLHSARIAEQLAEFSEGATLRSAGHRLIGVARFSAASEAVVSQPGSLRFWFGLPQTDELAAAVWSMVNRDEAPLQLAEGLEPDEVAMLSRGMSVQDMRALRSAGSPVTHHMIRTRKAVVLRDMLGDMATVVDEPVDLTNDVAGQPHVRALVARVKARFAQRGILLLRLLLAGPPGVGKSLVSTAVASELGLVAVFIRQVKSQWYGQSEERMNRLIDILEAAAPLVVVLDEADENGLGRRPEAAGSDGGATDSALRAMLLAWLGDTGAKLGVCVIAMTNRVDRLDDAAVSRLTPMAVSYPTPPELSQIVKIAARRRGVPLTEGAWTAMESAQTTMSGRDAVRVLDNADARALAAGGHAVTREDLEIALADTHTTVSPSERLQVLLSLSATVYEPDLPWNAGAPCRPDVVVPPDLRALITPEGRMDRTRLQREIDALFAAGHGR